MEPPRSFLFTWGALFALSLLCNPAGSHAAAPQIRPHTNGNYFVTAQGKPFLYLADTAWELLHRLDKDETDHYLRNRARKGFNVIHTAVLSELDGVRTPNANNDLPFENLDPEEPNEFFFSHVDAVINEAQALGLVVGLAPVWGDKINRRFGVGPGNFFTEETITSFGTYLAKRYKDEEIIWILGGDRNPDTEEHIDLWNALANALRTEGNTNQLITYFPMSGSSSGNWFPDADWLSFNACNSGQTMHRPGTEPLLAASTQLSPAIPVVEMEPPFEYHPIDYDPTLGWMNDWHVRQSAYRAFLSGIAGYSYGNHSIWQFWTKERRPISGVRIVWRDALEHSGAEQMGYLKAFLNSRPWHTLHGKGEFSPASPSLHVRAGDKNDFLFAYTALPKSFTLELGSLTGEQLSGYWLNPRDGTTTPIPQFKKEDSPKEFIPPSLEENHDWLLLVEDVAKGYPAP